MAASKAPKKKVKKVKKAAKKKTLDKAARKADPASIQDAAAAKARNPKAFVFSGRGKAKLQQARSAEKDQRRMHVPVVDTTPEEPPPYVIVVHGPPGVGKTTLIKNLLKHYTNQNIGDIKGPITVVSGKTRRLTFVECPQDLHGMIDAAKYADLVLLMVDGGFGFEMETFEFLNLLQVHGFPKVMGVLTHLDGFKDQKKLKKTKKALKHRFWAEIYQGAKLFYLSGMKNGKYMKREVLNLARFISVMKFRPLSWRMAHPYLLTDRLEDITPVEDIRQDPKCDRQIAVYGYLRGTKLKGQARVHIAGVGDTTVEEVDGLVDPCPLPSMLKKRGLNEKERLLYAPMADVGGLLYDKDAVYIDIPDWKMQYSKSDGGVAPRYDEGEDMVRQLQANQTGMDDRLHQSQINLFSHQQPLTEGLFDAQHGAAELESDANSDDEEDQSGSEDESDAASESGEESDEDSEEDDTGPSLRGLPIEETVAGSQRSRRRAVFSTEPVQADGEFSGEEEAGQDSDEDEDEHIQARLRSSSSAGSSGRDSDADSQDSEGLGRASHWKGHMQRHLAGLFSKRSANMQTYIYGTSALDATRGKLAQQAVPTNDGSGSNDDELFAPRSGQGREQTDNNADAVDAPDHSRVDLDDALLARWNEPGRTEQLRNRFVTGDWGAAGERDAARPGAEDEDDGDAFGEFEDLETGEKFGADGDQTTATAMQAIKDATAEEERQRVAEKASKKAAFNAEYDVGGGKGVKEKPGKVRKKSMQGEEEEEGAEETYYDAMKKDMTDRAARTKAAMDELDAEQRIAMEGYRPGTYIRLKFTGVPCELMQHFDPCQPLLVGGVSPSEEGVGFMQLRFKRHRWFPKILKTRDPLVFSIGWRRFQSVPVYAVEDSNGRHRMLKYTPEHMHCLATIHAALAPPNTGVLAIQTSTANAQSWRISATGVVLNLDASVRVMKKLKLKGTPFKVHKHTAFIGGMFNSQLEVSKFEGASIRTVSGIRGIVKKALRPGVQGGQDGSFRATFEDKPLMSDIVFLRAWIGVDLPRFYNPVTNLLGPAVKPLPRQLKPGHLAPEDLNAIALGATDANAVALPAVRPIPGASTQTPGTTPPGPPFQAASTFTGPRPGRVFKTGLQGTGYYPDAGLLQTAPAVAPAALATGMVEAAGDKKEGWTGMRTVAQLRRELGVGAPRDSDSLYKPIERGPRKFNPLKIPKNLQAQLPFKSKVINFPKRKQETLEQKRAIKVREPGDKRADALVHALNAIRNAKTEKRLDQQSRRREERKKKLALEDAWKKQYNKEERKKRYRDQGKAEKFAEKRQKRD